MTEDDTFRRLKRIPFEEMRRQIVVLNRLKYPTRVPLKHQALENGGWTLQEFMLARIEAAQRPAARN
jgi:hypothetical protein